MIAKIRIIISEDYVLFRTALKRALEEEVGLDVVGEADNGETTFQLAKEAQPNVVLIDAHLAESNMLDMMPKLLRWYPDIKVIVMTSYQNDPLVPQLLKLGALGVLTKEIAIEKAAEAIRTVYLGQRYISPGASHQMALERLHGIDKSPLEKLSSRESQVMMLVIQGMDIATIAKKLNLVPKTVSTYRYRIHEKLNVKNDLELIRFAVQHGLLTQD